MDSEVRKKDKTIKYLIIRHLFLSKKYNYSPHSGKLFSVGFIQRVCIFPDFFNFRLVKRMIVNKDSKRIYNTVALS